MKPIPVLDLFSGIGGMSLGLEMASPAFRTVMFCERDSFCRRVLAKHWPEVPQHDDVCTLDADALAAVGPVRLIAGGFPCQDVSVAGKGAGLDGERSGLWFEMRRVIDLVRPRWCLVENVPALRSRGGDRVISDLEASGYTCWPSVVGAVHAGAPHRRQRVWILAHADGDDLRQQPGRRGRQDGPGAAQPGQHGANGHVADAGEGRRHIGRAATGREARAGAGAEHGGQAVGLASLAGLPLGQGPAGQRAYAATAGAGWWRVESGVGRMPHGSAPGLDRGVMWPTPLATDPTKNPSGSLSRAVDDTIPWSFRHAEGRAATDRGAAVLQEPWERGIPRTVGKGFPNRVPRLQALGNAVVPQVVAMFGRWIAMVEEAGE